MIFRSELGSSLFHAMSDACGWSFHFSEDDPSPEQHGWACLELDVSDSEPVVVSQLLLSDSEPVVVEHDPSFKSQCAFVARRYVAAAGVVALAICDGGDNIEA
jgi:hypothetical protein